MLQKACLWSLLAIAFAANANAQSTRVLAPGQSSSGVIAGAETASFEITAEAGSYVRAVVIEHGKDLVASVVSPDRKELLSVDRFDGSDGREVIAFIAPLTGTYVVTVKPEKADASRGFYEFLLEAVRHPVGDDCLRLELEEELLEGDRQARQGSAESIRKALERYGRAVDLAEHVGDNTARAVALLEVGGAHGALGERQLALDPFTDAVAIARATNDRPLEALGLFSLGSLNGSLGDNREAFDNLNAALEIYRNLGDTGWQAATINALAVRFKDIGEVDEALAHYTEALAISREAGDIGGQPTALNNLGNLHYDQGNWDEALAHFEEALKLWRQIGSRRGEAATIYNIGLVYAEQGEIDRALPYIRQALAIARETGHRAGEAMCLYRLGLASEDLGQLDEALDYLSDALSLYRSIGDRRNEAIALVCLGRIHARRGEFDQAFDHYQRALPLAKATSHKWGEAFTHKHLADAWAACGAPLLALEEYRQALDLYESLGQHVWRARTLVAMAETLDAAERTAEARDTIDEALNVIEQLQANVTSRELKAVYLSSVRKGYEISIDLLMRENDARAALHVSERARARSFLDLLAESSAKIRHGVASDLLQRQRELRRSLTAKIERQIRRREANQKEDADLNVAQLTEELEQIERKIRASNPQYARSTDRVLEAGEIQTLLDPDTVLLEYALGEQRSYLWVVSSKSISSHVLPARNAMEPIARRLIELLQDRATAVGNEALLRKTSRQLAEMLLPPAARSLKAKRLVIAADGILHYVPFAMLTDRFELVSVPSASSLAALREQLAARPTPPKALAVFADPVFRAEDSRIAVAQTRDDDPAMLARLPYTRREARAILAFVPESLRKEALGFEASRTAALSPELAQYRVVHFATHGFFNTARPQLSGIVLSLVDEKGHDQAGFLLTSDVFGMNLAADLVVLSGCRTALGREVYGEGITGLSRAFLFAGAARVMASLWKVDDAATAALMTHFYRGLFVEKLPPAAALKAAQVRLRNQERWASPYYWAGFVLQGDWK